MKVALFGHKHIRVHNRTLQYTWKYDMKWCSYRLHAQQHYAATWPAMPPTPPSCTATTHHTI